MSKSNSHAFRDKRRVIFCEYLLKSLLWDENFPQLVQYFFFVASNFQCICILLWGQIKLLLPNQDDQILKTLAEVSKFWIEKDLLGYDSHEVTIRIILIIFLLYFLLFLMGFCFLIVRFLQRKKVSRKESFFITLFTQMHMSIVSWIINVVLMDYLGVYLFNRDNLIQSIEDPFIVFFAIFVFLSINNIMGILFSVFSYDPFLTSNTFATHSCLFQFYTYLLKSLLCPIITIFSNPTFVSWAFASLSLAMTGIRHYHLLVNFPYYKYSAMMTSTILSNISMLISILSFLTMVIKGLGQISITLIIYTEILFVPLSIKCITTYMQHVVTHYLSVKEDSLQTKRQVFKRLFALSIMMKEAKLSANNNINKGRKDLYFHGIFKRNLEQQLFDEIYIDRRSLKSDTGSIERTSILNQISSYYMKAIEIILQNALIGSLDTLKQDSQIRIILAHLSVKHDKSCATSILYVEDFSKLTGHVKLAALKLRDKLEADIEQFFKQNKGKILDLKTYIEQEYASVTFIKMIHSSTKKYLDFWNIYSDTKMGMKELFQKSKQIEEEFENIHSLWKKFNNESRLFAGTIGPIYSIYLSIIRNTPYLAHKVVDIYHNWSLEKIYSHEHDSKPLSEETLNSPNIMIFYASMARERPGKVIYASPNVTELTGWTQSDVIEQNINVVMPFFMREKHNQILLNHLKSFTYNSAPSKMYKTINTFILHKSGHVVPCEVYISIYPQIQNVPTYLSLVRIKKMTTDQLLVGQGGWIEGFTANLAKTFNLVPDRKVNLRDICKDYIKLAKAMNISVTSQNIKKDSKKDVKTERQSRWEIVFKEDLSNNSDEESMNQCVLIDFGTPTWQQKKEFISMQKYFVHVGHQSLAGTNYHVLNLESNSNEDNDDQDSHFATPMHSRTTFSIAPERFPSETISNAVPGTLISAKRQTTAENMMKTSTFNQNNEALDVSSPITQHNLLTTTSPGFVWRNYSPFTTSRRGSRELSQPYLATTPVSQNNLGQEGASPRLDVEAPLNTKVSFGPPTKRLTESCEYMEKGDYIAGPPTTQRDLIHFKPQPIHENIYAKNPESSPAKAPDLIFGTSSVDHSFKTFMIKLEQAVNVVPKNNKLNIFNWILILFIVLLIAPLIYFQFQSDHTLSLVQTSVQAISKSVFRLVRITDLGQYARNLWQAKLGLYTDDRYEFLGWHQNAAEVLKMQIMDIVVDLNQKNNELRSFVDNMDEDLQDRLYNDRIPVYEMNAQGKMVVSRYSNVFDLITDLVSQGRKLVTSGFVVDETNPYLMFCLNNTFNELLISSQNTIPILLQDSEHKLETQSRFAVISMICMLFVAIFVLAFFYTIFRKFVKERDQFLTIFLRLDKQKIFKHICTVQKFAYFLEKNNFNNKKLSSKIQDESFNPTRPNRLEESKARHLKSFDGINMTLGLLYLMTALLVFLLFSAYPVLLFAVNIENRLILNKMALKVQSNLNLYNTNFLLTTIYDYIQENVTSIVRNRPIKEEWENTFYEMTKVQDFLLIKLMDSKNGLGQTPQLYTMAVGSLCDNVPTADENLAKMCKNIGGGAVEKGIVGFNSYTLASVKGVKDFFDYSDRTPYSMMEALSMKDLVSIEVFYPFTYRAYVWIDNLIESLLTGDFEKFRKIVISIATVYFGIYITIGGIVWQAIKKRLRKEMSDWRKMMRNIPLTIIKDNKMLKRYLAKNSNGVFGYMD